MHFHSLESAFAALRDTRLSLRNYFLLFLIPAGAALAEVCIFIAFVNLSPTDAAFTNARAVFTLDEVPYITSASPTGDSSSFIEYSLPLIVFIVSYALIVYYGARTWYHMRRVVTLAGTEDTRAAARRDAAQRQLTAVIILQAALPLLFGFVLGVYTTVSNGIHPEISTTTASAVLTPQALLTVSTNWSSVVNGVLTLVIIRPYREALLSALPCFHRRAGNNAAIGDVKSGVSATIVSSAAMPSTLNRSCRRGYPTSCFNQPRAE